MTREPASDAELSLAKAYLVGSFPLRLDTSGKVADFVSAVEELGLGLDYAERYKAGVSRVTARDVQRAAQRFFAPESFSRDRKSTRLNSSHLVISYAVFCLKKKKKKQII